MAPSFRFHLVTLVAIFLALGVGMVLGSSYLQGAIVDRLTRQLETLNTQFTAEVGPLRDQVRKSGDALAAVAPIVAQGRLKGQRLALIVTGDYPEVARRMRETLVSAGAAILSTTRVSDDYTTRIDEALPVLFPRLGAGGQAPRDRAFALAYLAGALARGAAQPQVQLLEDTRVLDVDGDYTSKVDAVIVVSGTLEGREARIAEIDEPLVAALIAGGLTVVATEPSTAVVSCVPTLGGAEITTIDNVDTDIGRMALVLAIRGPRGDYGTRPTARSGLLPSSTDTH